MTSFIDDPLSTPIEKYRHIFRNIIAKNKFVFKFKIQNSFNVYFMPTWLIRRSKFS
jgi:hypothetical protein